MSPENEALLRNLKRAGLVVAGIWAAILVIGGVTRYVQASNLQSWTGAVDVPTVALITPTSSGNGQALTLPGTLEAWYDAKIYSRVPGYVKSWQYDIGAHVKKGDVLAVIDTPELDQQLAQARADLSAAQSNEKDFRRYRRPLEQPVAAGCGVKTGRGRKRRRSRCQIRRRQSGPGEAGSIGGDEGLRQYHRAV